MADLESTHSSSHALSDEVDPERRDTHSESGGQSFDDPDTSGDDAMADVMDVQADVAGDYGEDMLLAEGEQGGGKRVKVSILTSNSANFSRSTSLGIRPGSTGVRATARACTTTTMMLLSLSLRQKIPRRRSDTPKAPRDRGGSSRTTCS